MDVAALQSFKNGYAICVTKPIKRRNTIFNEDFFAEGYASDGDIGPFFDAFADEEDIEYYTEEFINHLVYFQGSMDPAVATTIEVAAPPVEAE